MNRHLKKALEKLTCPQELRFYDLGHTAASWAIRSGALVEAVQRMLGHTSAVITLNVYSHLFDDELDSVADRWGRCSEGTQRVQTRQGAA
ncbi:MAG: tyrosine-type recombinase/integrase [Micrococcaceae bacterium]|nr:tyrosine-type recombinase/integrase [Micrococcaceae bacterium]